MHENNYPLVSNPKDPRFLLLRSLQTPQGRSRTGQYVVEGIRHLAQAAGHHAPIQSIFLDPSVLSNAFGRKLVRRLRQSGIRGVRLSRELYRELTLAAEPQGIGAVLRQRWIPLNDVRLDRDSFWLAVESIESSGNLGTIIRSAEATGVNGIFLLGDECDPYDPAAVRATMGSLFSQKLIKCSVGEFGIWAKSSGVSVVASSPAGLLDYKALRCRWPVVLVIGSEKRGLSERILEFANFTIRIPMLGSCDSLNAAVAAGVLLFEIANQRTRRSR